MAEPFLGEIRLCSFPYAPKGWAFCNGQLLSINQNQALFSLLGTMYGGDGRTTFGLPDFRGRRPISSSNMYPQGARGGTETHTLTGVEIPPHTHAVHVSSAAGGNPTLQNGYLAASTVDAPYSNGTAVGATSGMVQPNSGSQPHNNLPPYLVVNFVIALQGIFPSRS